MSFSTGSVALLSSFIFSIILIIIFSLEFFPVGFFNVVGPYFNLELGLLLSLHVNNMPEEVKLMHD